MQTCINLVSNFFWHKLVWLDLGYSWNQRKMNMLRFYSTNTLPLKQWKFLSEIVFTFKAYEIRTFLPIKC